jgi:hypothetical protein
MKAYLHGIVAALVALGAALIYARGRKDANDANELREHNEYIETRKRMDAADGPSDADVQRWLHERGQYKRDL